VQKFNELAGVPVCYNRVKGYDHVAICRGEYADQRLIDALSKTFEKLWEYTGKAEVILTAGAYTRKPGWHGRGMAFDLDGFIFKGERFMALDYPEEKRFYLGVEAILRATFPGTILNFRYNPAHHDHWHMQMDGVWNFRKTRSQTLWLQDALNTAYDMRLVLDGVYGPKTDKALKWLWVLNDIGRDWRKFCLAIGVDLLA